MGSALERRVWGTLVQGLPIYANIFSFLVGPPGSGKTIALVPMSQVLRKSGVTHMAPNDVSKASLLDALGDAKAAVTFAGAGSTPPVIIEYHYLTLVVRELSNFMSQYDNQLAGLLTDIFDNPPVNDERKRGNPNASPIVRPSISMIAGTATKNLGKTIGSDLWGQGFMSRVILVYSADKLQPTFFGDDDDEHAPADVVGRAEQLPPALVDGITQIGRLKGKMRWTKDAQGLWMEWAKEDFKPFPSHSKLVEYNARRWLHVFKLAMISAAAELRMTIEAQDFLRARAWLEEAEKSMPEIFKEMLVHNDGELLRELHMYIWSLYSRARKPIPYSTLAGYLYSKVASRDLKRLIEVGEAAGLYDRVAGTHDTNALFIPKPMIGDISV